MFFFSYLNFHHGVLMALIWRPRRVYTSTNSSKKGLSWCYSSVKLPKNGISISKVPRIEPGLYQNHAKSWTVRSHYVNQNYQKGGARFPSQRFWREAKHSSAYMYKNDDPLPYHIFWRSKTIPMQNVRHTGYHYFSNIVGSRPWRPFPLPLGVSCVLGESKEKGYVQLFNRIQSLSMP